MNSESNRQNLHYQIMGIGLAFVAHKKDSHCSKVLGHALDRLDWASLSKVKKCFDALPRKDQRLILQGQGNNLRIADSLAHLEIAMLSSKAIPGPQYPPPLVPATVVNSTV